MGRKESNQTKSKEDKNHAKFTSSMQRVFTYYNTGMTGIYFSMIKIYKSWQINMVSIFVLFYLYMVV